MMTLAMPVCTIRRAGTGDEDAISRVILAALRETNAGDYSDEIIARVEKSFSHSAMHDLMDRREVYVATLDGRVVGTASRDGGTVRSMFVAPDAQGRGIGRMLIDAVERAARHAGFDRLTVPGSITAEEFYARIGYSRVLDVCHGDERTIIMERRL